MKTEKGTITFDYDIFCETPWEYSDCHGPVRKSNNAHNEYRSDKRPEERPLNSADRNEYQFYYDWQKAMKIAIKDWGCPTKTKALEAVQDDFEYLRGWVNNEWYYVVITVEYEGEIESMGMVETYGNYHLACGKEMLESLIASVTHRKLIAWRSALKEARARKYWASRDVCTV